MNRIVKDCPVCHKRALVPWEWARHLPDGLWYWRCALPGGCWAGPFVLRAETAAPL